MSPGPLSCADHLAIEQVLVRYAVAIDTRDYDLLDEVFLADAHIDYRSTGGIAGVYAEVRPWLERTMADYRILQHFVSNVRVTGAGVVGGAGGGGGGGEELRAHSYVHAVHGYRREGVMRFFDLGGEYEDTLTRTDAGFRLQTRVLHARWFRGELPDG